MALLSEQYLGEKIFLLKEINEMKTAEELAKFVKHNKIKVGKGGGFTRYLIASKNDKTLDPIEYFYLEEPVVPQQYFPLKIYGIYDRITLEEHKLPRLKEDIIKILAESNKFGVRVDGTNRKPPQTTKATGELLGTSNIEINTASKSNKKKKEKAELTSQATNYQQQNIHRCTDKMFCPNCNITYPEFTTQHFSPNRQEGACAHCHGIGEVLKVDIDKVLDPNAPLESAILPWRDSNYGQAILHKLCEKYAMDIKKVRKEQPERFLHTIMYGDNELLRIHYAGKRNNLKYQGMEEIIKEQFAKGVLTVDFQAMLEMRPCPECFGSRLKKESLHVFLSFPEQALS